jgi:hypothetical protein
MPNGFWYASGPYRTVETIAGSAFSKGDLLEIDSNSSLSRMGNPYAAVGSTLYAVATSDSDDSVNNRVSGIIPEPTTHFWSRTTSGVTLIPGENSGVSFDAAAPGRFWVDESTTTLRVVVVNGTGYVDQSVQSKVIVRFKYAAGELDLS